MKYRELVGIYQANGSIVGEIQYVWGKLLGTRHCSLCDITHGWVRETTEFRACRERLRIPIRTIHLDERSEDLYLATENRTPCVVGRCLDGWEVVLSSDQLQSCNGSVRSFERLLNENLGV